MNWFYAQDGQQKGPVDEGELDGLVRRGDIIASTLVWHSGLANWQPYQQVRPANGPVAAAERPLSLQPVGAGEARCAECGQVFPADDVVRLGGVDVCAGCKPLFLQKLREGAPVAGEMPYAGFWIRFAAVFFDGLIMMPVTFLVWGAILYFSPQLLANGGGPFSLLRVALQVFSIALAMGYETFFIGRYGATPGKMICDLRVVRSDGTRLTYGRACGRYFAKMLSQFTLGIGYLMAAFDDQKRALHDHVADTRVVRK